MDIDKLLRFCAVVDYGSMSKAADTLYCSQPALSKQILALEKELGYPLFDRHGKKMVLNKNGQLLYNFGRHLEQDFNQLKTDLYALNCSSHHEISFGATNCIGTYLLPPILIDFKKQHHDIPVNFMLNFFPNIMEMLNQDIISFALIPENEDTLHNPSYICHPFYNDDMVVVFPPEHPLASLGETIPPKELLNYPFLISQIQSATRRFIISRLNAYNIQLHNMQNLYNTETIKLSVMIGMGISILSKISIEAEQQNGSLKTAHLQGVNLFRKLYLIHKKNKILLPEYHMFIQHVLEKDSQSNKGMLQTK